jgi:hypothetical protein
MGYRSDVMAIIYPEAQVECGEKAAYEQLKVLMATTFKDVINPHFAENATWMDNEHVLKFNLPDVKWYPSYADVQMFEAMLSAFGDDIPGYCTEFVRVGEEDDDTESRRTGEDNQYYLNVRRSIDCNI